MAASILVPSAASARWHAGWHSIAYSVNLLEYSWNTPSPSQLALSQISGHSQEVSKSQETFPTDCLHLTIPFNMRTRSDCASWPTGYWASPGTVTFTGWDVHFELTCKTGTQSKCCRSKPLLKETKRGRTPLVLLNCSEVKALNQGISGQLPYLLGFRLTWSSHFFTLY